MSAEVEVGRVVGGRFLIERFVTEDPLGSLHAARDQKTSKAIALRMITPGLFATPEAGETLRAEVRLATTTTHRHMATVFGSGADSGVRFVASEWSEGTLLSELIPTRRRFEEPFPIEEALAITAQVAEALLPLHAKGAPHGGVRPGAVWVAGEGARLADTGLTRAVLRTAGATAFGPSEAASFAPELRHGATDPMPAADIFGIGAVFYGLVCLRTPSDAFEPPSRAHPNGTAAMDAFLQKCLAADPAARFASMSQLRAALDGLSSRASIAVDIPLSIAPSMRPGAPPVSIPKAPLAPKIPSAPQLAPPTRAAPPQAAPPAAVTGPVDLATLLKRISQNDAPRWMATMNGLDHGPFSGREVVELIAKGEIRGEHGLLNMDTGARKPVSEWPDFAEFAEQNRIKRTLEAERHALHSSVKQEKRSNIAKFALAGLALTAVLAVGGVYLATREGGWAGPATDANAGTGDLFERGAVDISAVGILPDPPARRGGGGGGRRPGGGLRAGGTYEEAMDQPIDMGDITATGSQSRLSQQQILGTMNARMASFDACFAQENPGRVRIDIAIAGTGQVLGSSVRAGSPSFQQCMRGRVAGVRFPSFGAPRMGASYTISGN